MSAIVVPQMKIKTNSRHWLLQFALCVFAAPTITAQSHCCDTAAQRMKQTVEVLSAPAMEGRGPGTSGLDASAEFIRGEFRKAGLKSGAPDGTFFQSFVYAPGPSGKELRLRNVIGELEATTGSTQESIIIGAHYDHLGFGPAFSLAPEDQKHSLHPGADDNASGVAMILELAHYFADQGIHPHKRIIFIAFSGEEEGDLGSHYYVGHPIVPLADTITMINLDMVGRVRENILGRAGNKSGDSFDAMLDHAVLKSRLTLMRGGDQYPDDSDHAPFAAAGIPILYVCSGSHEDRHRPSDTADKINAQGMGDEAILLESLIDTLLQSPRPHFVARPQ
jgi:aminopeptidase N